MKVWLVRHGESEANILNILYNRGDKYGLTQKGIEQVNKLLLELKDIKIHKIYSSPLLRAKETARIVADNWNLDFEVTKALSEFDVGILDETGEESTFHKEQEIVEQWLIDKKWDVKFEDGESYNEIKERFLNLFESLKIKSDENVVLVSHGGLIQCMVPLICENLSFIYCHKKLLKNAEYALLEINKDKVICIKYGN
jgi:broad specificity phosphatase PhoE